MLFGKQAETVEDVLGEAGSYISRLKNASERTAAKAEEKRLEANELLEEIGELTNSAEQGKVVAARFEELLTVK